MQTTRTIFNDRRTPRRKLVFSSSDDEADDSPQSITSVLNVRQEYHHSIIQDEQLSMKSEMTTNIVTRTKLEHYGFNTLARPASLRLSKRLPLAVQNPNKKVRSSESQHSMQTRSQSSSDSHSDNLVNLFDKTLSTVTPNPVRDRQRRLKPLPLCLSDNEKNMPILTVQTPEENPNKRTYDEDENSDHCRSIKRSKIFEENNKENNLFIKRSRRGVGLIRSLTEPSEEQVKVSVELGTNRDLVGDRSRSYLLPRCKSRKHPDLACISPETMVDVLNQKFSSEIENLHIIDCRYPYEYEGGHIDSAKNIYTRSQVYDAYFRQPLQLNDHEVIVCEEMMKLELVALAIWMASILGGECKVVQFIFGDSLSDVGNNMHLSRSLAQASLPWYGIDFGNGLPNGRFTNGRTVADIIGDSTGLPRPPAFLDPSLTDDLILENGVNYASGGGGILNETGGYFIQRLSLNKQIELFQGTQRMIINKIGEEKSRKFFQESQYVVALGSNDFINNYLMPVYSDSWKYNDQTFIDYLMDTLEGQLRKLHGLGARELIVFGLGPMGCIPLQRVLSTTGECQEKTNKLALAFNGASSKLLDKLSNKLANASFKFGDAYDVVNDVISNPYKYGFNNSDSPCCSFGQIRPALTCLPASTLCEDRSKYVFWDEYHPSDSANELIAKELIKKFGFTRVNGNKAPASAPSPATAHSPALAPSPEG